MVAALWAIEGGITPRIGWGWWLWGALLPVCVAAAVWTEETADEGCLEPPGGTALAILVLVLIGAVAVWLPAMGLRFMVTHASVWRRVGFLFMSAVWLVIWGYFWLVVLSITRCAED